MAESAAQILGHPGAAPVKAPSERLTVDEHKSVRQVNIIAARGVAESLRTSLGPRGMDKMLITKTGNVIITNDGATILKELNAVHPCSKMLVELSQSQDSEAGDGTTSVVIIAGAILEQCEKLLEMGFHPLVIAKSFSEFRKVACSILENMQVQIPRTIEGFKTAVETSLASKVVSHSSGPLADLALTAVTKIVGSMENARDVNINDIRVVGKVGGNIEDTKLVEGIILPDNKPSSGRGGITTVNDAKIAVVQFCIAPPKTDMECNVVVKNYTQIDAVIREERMITAQIVKSFKQIGCNVILLQKSVIREAITELALDYCAKAKIMVVRNVDRKDIEYICNATKCTPMTSIDAVQTSALGFAKCVSLDNLNGDSVFSITGLPEGVRACSILCRGTQLTVVEETERSMRDALCVARSLIRDPALVPGGGAIEAELSVKIREWARTQPGKTRIMAEHYADAFEVIPSTLAENSGHFPAEVVAKLRQAHCNGESHSGIHAKTGELVNMTEHNIVMPTLVAKSLVTMATETVQMILKIDDILITRE